MSESGRQEHIVFVDDEPQVLRALVRDVKPWADGHDLGIETAESGLDCIDLLSDLDGEVSVVVSDLRMPFVQGGELLVEMRKRYPDAGFVLLTAYSDADEMQKAVAAGVSCYILKPWDVDPLIAQLDQTLELVRARRENASYQKQINQQLRMAGEFQRSFLWVDPPHTDRLAFDITYQPMSDLYCGGDYYDVVAIDDHRWAMLVGDVAGHGVKSALVTAMLKIFTRDQSALPAAERGSAAAWLNALNRLICQRLSGESGLLVTFSATIVDVRRMSIRVANAGHLPAYLLRRKTCLSLQVDGPALGFSEIVRYPEKEYDLAPGDIITTFTDGLTESGHAGTPIENDHLEEILVKSSGAVEFNRRLLELAHAEHGTDVAADDVTVLTTHVR